MILAEATPDPKALLQFAIIINFLLAMGSSAASVAAFWSSRRTQRREISFARELASKEELLHLVRDCDRLVKITDEIRTGMKEEMAEIRATLKHDRELIEAAASGRQDKLERRLETLSGAVTDLYRRVGNHE